MKKKNMFMDIKAIKVCKLMHICAIIYNLWCLGYNNRKNTKFYDLAYDRYWKYFLE